jgi:hypothetical protein
MSQVWCVFHCFAARRWSGAIPARLLTEAACQTTPEGDLLVAKKKAKKKTAKKKAAKKK